MGVDGRLKPARVRQLERQIGQKLATAVAVDHEWFECVTPTDLHLLVHRRTGEVRTRSGFVTHFWSCPTVRQEDI